MWKSGEPEDFQVTLPAKEEHLTGRTNDKAKICLKYGVMVLKVLVIVVISVGISTLISYSIYEQGDAHYRQTIADNVRRDNWTAWSPWGDCSTTCGTGTKVRTRRCIGNNCGDYAIDRDLCLNPDCKVNKSPECYREHPAVYIDNTTNDRTTVLCTDWKYDWTKWSPWGSCSVTCGAGTRIRTRNCSGNNCGEYSIEKDVCSNHYCKGSWNDWSSWSECSAMCGAGIRNRNRTCNGSHCGEQNTQSELCTNPACVGDWSTWGSWSQCSVTCGAGMQVRHRTCDSDHPCDDSFTDKKVCSAPVCKEEWNAWGAWGACSVSVGTGTRSRVRSCSQGYCGLNWKETEQCTIERGYGKNSASTFNMNSLMMVVYGMLVLICVRRPLLAV